MLDLENRMLIDSEWNEEEYGVPRKHRGFIERYAKAFEAEEREEEENDTIRDKCRNPVSD